MSALKQHGACPQVFSGLQGHPSAGGHGGGYPDGEDGLFDQIKMSFLFLIFRPETTVADVPPLSFQVATDVIKEFAADGVKYLELRSTPREEKNTGEGCQHGARCILMARFNRQDCFTRLQGVRCLFFPRIDKKEIC